MSKKSTKIVVKDFFEGDEIDLSLQTLTTATLPLKEISNLKKGKKLDLSKNQITMLPDNFVPLMGHLVKLDLSGNGLTELPANFGNLSLLIHLDLFNNGLSALPISIFQLSKLRWLDLKENPELTFPPSDVVGMCRNDVECKTCATQVVQFLRSENRDQESKRQKELEAKKAKKEALKKELKRLEELENMEKRRIRAEEKAAEKARRRAEYEALAAERSRAESEEEDNRKPDELKSLKQSRSSPSSSPSSSSSLLTWMALLFAAASVLIAIFCPEIVPCCAIKGAVLDGTTMVADTLNPVLASINEQLLTSAPSLHRSLLSTWELLLEMTLIGRDTFYLGYELALKEFNALSTYANRGTH